VVQTGDTLFRIAFSNQVTVADLVQWNGIRDPNLIFIGQKIRVQDPSARVSNANSDARSEPTQTAAALDINSPVAPAWNVAPNGVVSQGMGEPEVVPGQLEVTTIEPGTTLANDPARAGDPGPSTPPATSAGLNNAQPTLPAELSSSEPAAQAFIDEATMPAPNDATAIAVPAGSAAPTVAGAAPVAVRGIWAWPLTGKLTETYVSGDQTRSGIKISAAEGSPIFAAADGEVIFSGTGIMGYGELIVVQHSGGMLSAYGHNRVRKVQEGAKVKRGQIIGEVGKDLIGRNLLHFEVRQNGKPVDPLRYLPERRG